VLIAAPTFLNPVMDASEITVSGADRGKIAVAHGFAHHGEAVRRKRANGGQIEEIWVGGTRFVPEQKAVAELTSRYAKRSRPRPPAKARRAHA
jgi:D-alanyl-D-alanine carboxypeptidase